MAGATTPLSLDQPGAMAAFLTAIPTVVRALRLPVSAPLGRLGCRRVALSYEMPRRILLNVTSLAALVDATISSEDRSGSMAMTERRLMGEESAYTCRCQVGQR